jgi:hypothetical protein
MKNISLFFLLVMLVAFSACNYKDGPLVSLRSREARIENTWVPEKADINGVDGLIADANGVHYVDGDTAGYYLALKEITFLEQGGCQLVYKTTVDNNYSGAWSVSKDGKQLHIAVGPPVFGMPYVTMDWDILRLNENHMRVTYIWETNLFLVDFVTKE